MKEMEPQSLFDGAVKIKGGVGASSRLASRDSFDHCALHDRTFPLLRLAFPSALLVVSSSMAVAADDQSKSAQSLQAAAQNPVASLIQVPTFPK